MTGQINVDKIAARSGNTITIDTGDALDVTLVKGEGSATTNLKQGVLKAWYGYDLYSSQNSFEGSFNVSSGTDDGTGDVTSAYTNNMSSQDYVASTSGPDNALTNTQADNSDGKVSRTTAGYKSRQRSYNGSAFDGIHYIHVAGDLA